MCSIAALGAAADLSAVMICGMGAMFDCTGNGTLHSMVCSMFKSMFVFMGSIAFHSIKYGV